MGIEELQKLDLKDLKAMAFDIQVLIDNNNQNKQILLQLIQEKKNEAVSEEAVKEEDIKEEVKE